jgi:HK97 family phage prohead protease
MERKSLLGGCEFKVNLSQRVIKAFASRPLRDEHGELLPATAFTKTIKERKSRIVTLRGHDPDKIVGKPLEMIPQSDGLYTETKIARTPLGDETLELAAEEMLTGVSIGFDPIAGKTSYELVDGKKTRVIHEVKLYEYSFVAFPASEEARITGVKERAGSKSLADVADVLGALEYVRSILRDRPPLTEEEATLLQSVLAAMRGTETDLTALLEPAGDAPTTPSTEPPSATDAKGSSLVTQLADLAAAVQLHNLTKEIRTWNPN